MEETINPRSHISRLLVLNETQTKPHRSKILFKTDFTSLQFPISLLSTSPDFSKDSHWAACKNHKFEYQKNEGLT